MATTLEDLVKQAQQDPTVQRRLRNTGVTAAPAIPPAPGPAAPPAAQPPADDSIESMVAAATKENPNLGKPRPAPQEGEPGFWKSAWEQVNPVAAVKGVIEGRRAIQREREDFAKTHPGTLDQFLHEGKMTWDVAKGVLGAPVDIAKNLYWDAKQGRWRTALGTATGIGVPIALGYGLKKLFPGKAVLPKGPAAVQKAEAEFQKVRGTLPTTTGPQLQTSVEKGAESGLARSYAQREGLHLAGRQAASAKYATYDKTLSKVVEPPGLELRPAEFKVTADGEIVQTKPALKTTVEWKAPVETAPFRTELEQLIEHDHISPFPAGTPIRKFLDALGVEKAGVEVSGTEPALSKGFARYQFDTLKKAVGELSQYANESGVTRDPYQGLATQIVKKAKPLMINKLKEIARKSKIPIRDVVNSMQEGDQAWAKVSQGFDYSEAPMGKAETAYVRRETTKRGASTGIQPAKGSITPEKAIEAAPAVEQRAKEFGAAKAATQQATGAWLEHLTKDVTTLNAHTSTGLVQTPEVLGALVDHFKSTRNWTGFAKLDPEVIQALTAHQPDLAKTIPAVFRQIAEAEKLHGAAEAQSALTRAITGLNRVSKSAPVRYLSPLPHAVHAGLDDLTTYLQNQDSARRLNQALRVQIARIPTSTRIVRGAATAAQAAPVGTTVGKGLGMVAATPPPPSKTQMAGEQ